MTDVETRLAEALRELVQVHDAPPGIRDVAARRATRIRQRRRAAGGLGAAAAAVCAGTLITQPRGEAQRVQLTPLASASADASGPDLSTDDSVRVVYTRVCGDGPSIDASVHCVRIGLETTSSAGLRHYDLTDRRTPAAGQSEPEPQTLLAEYSDRTTREVKARRVDSDTWTFEVPARPGLHVARLEIRTDDGQVQILGFLEEE